MSEGDFPQDSDQPANSEEEEELDNDGINQFALKHFRLFGIPTDDLELYSIIDPKVANKIKQ